MNLTHASQGTGGGMRCTGGVGPTGRAVAGGQYGAAVSHRRLCRAPLGGLADCRLVAVGRPGARRVGSGRSGQDGARQRPRRRAGPPQRDIVVVIAGLDETPSPHATSALVELLADRLTTRVAGLRLLLTVRSGPDLTRLDPDVRFDLVEDCPTGVDDVREYLDA